MITVSWSSRGVTLLIPITIHSRQEIIMLVLATDMARHSEIVEGFKGKLDTFDFHNDEYLNSVSLLWFNWPSFLFPVTADYSDNRFIYTELS